MATLRMSRVTTWRAAQSIWSGTTVPVGWNQPTSLAVVVFAGYYIATLAGLLLRLPPATPSVVWPPNAVLTTALLFTAPTQWWVVLLAALPAHLLLEANTFPLPLVAAFYVTNCGEALLAAWMIRRFSDAPTQFDSLQRALIFIGAAVIVAPIASSFLDAAAVTLIMREPYWATWWTRTLSNSLGALAVVPAACGLLTAGVWEMVRLVRERWLELAVIAFALVILAVDSHGPAEPFLPRAVFLPLLLWTAVRFGPAGVGFSLLATVLIFMEAVVSGSGPLGAMAADVRVPVVQTFLISTAIPSLCVAALTEERRYTESALRSADLTKTAILASLPSQVAVLDRFGSIIAVNGNWIDFAVSLNLISAGTTGVGRSYTELWGRAIGAGIPGVDGAIEGVADVLLGTRPSFAFEYALPVKGSQHWYSVSAVPLQRPDGGAVITHTDITDRRRAEMEAQTIREELAHVSRVWVLGELTASLSHQLNQPLAAIAGNATAGSRLLDAGEADQREMQHIFADIAADATRASEVIRGLRDLLRKRTEPPGPVDINDLIVRTHELVRSESLRHAVNIRLTLTPSLPVIVGNRVQLQQVILNLLMNAIQAASAATRDRLVTVRTSADDEGVGVSVEDTGYGLEAGGEALVFEPFHTTKPSGMGMGLPIARAIVEAHGGSINGSNGENGGAVFSLTLPIAGTASHMFS